MNITEEAFKQMQLNVKNLANKKDNHHISVGGFSKSGRPNLEEAQKELHKNKDGRIRINIKPLSSNKCWVGRRFKTPDYKKYTTELTKLLPKLTIPKPPYKIYYKFGFSSASSDWDNPIKPMQDIIAAKYQFNDKLIRKAIVEIEMVKKGQEFIEFKIESLNGN